MLRRVRSSGSRRGEAQGLSARALPHNSHKTKVVLNVPQERPENVRIRRRSVVNLLTRRRFNPLDTEEIRKRSCGLG